MNIFQAIMTVGHDEDYQPMYLGRPTSAPPGSLEKVEVMRKRVELGHEIFHPGDEWILASLESARVMSSVVHQIAKMRKTQ